MILAQTRYLAALTILVTANATLELGADSKTNEPEQISLEHPESADPEQDCRAAVQAGDWRFLMMPVRMGEVSYPGVPRYAEHLVKEKGVKVIKEASTFFGDEQANHRNVQAELYAARYNEALLKKIPGSDQPESGYGIPKPNDIVLKGSEYTAADIAQGRDLSLYDKGGHFVACSSNLPRIRAFIWRHWHNKQRGYVRITVSGADSPATLHFFIEPDRQGDWRIALRTAKSHNRVYDQPIIFSVARVKRTEFDNLGSYVLTFKASDGSELLRL